MKDTIYFYIIVGLMLIVPVIALNARKFTRYEPGVGRKANWKRIVCVAAASVLLGALVVSNCIFTIHYQPYIVSSEFAIRLGRVIEGSQSPEEMIAGGGDILAVSDAEMGNFTAALKEAAGTGQTVRFQLGDEITPKYWEDEEIFAPYFQGVETGKDFPVYSVVMLEVDGQLRNYLIGLDRPDSQAKIIGLREASDELVDYCKSKRYIRGEQVLKWHDVD